jgi:hypothetical protein
LRPVKYVNKLNNKIEYGLIAHELQEYYPELVSGFPDPNSESDTSELQTVNYIGLISILIKEFQALKRENKNIKEKLNSLMEMINIMNNNNIIMDINNLDVNNMDSSYNVL